MRVVKETSVSVPFDGGNQSGMVGMHYAAPRRPCDTPGVEPKARAIVRELKPASCQMRQRGQLKRQLALRCAE